MVSPVSRNNYSSNKPQHISLNIKGKAVWVKVTDATALKESDKTSSEWLKIDFTTKRNTGINHKYVSQKSLIDAGIPKEVILKHKNNLSFLLAAQSFYYENELLLKTYIKGIDLDSFLDLFVDNESKLHNLIQAKTSEEKKNLLDELVSEKAAKNHKTFPDDTEENPRATVMYKGKLWNQQDLPDDEIETASVKSDHSRHSNEGPSSESISDLSSEVSMSESISDEDIEERYTKFYEAHQKLFDAAGIVSSISDLMQMQTTITIDDLEQAVDSLDELIIKLALLETYHKLKEQQLIPDHLDEQAITDLELHTNKNFSFDLQTVSLHLQKLLTNPEFQKILSKYSVKKEDLISYVLHHPKDIKKVISCIEEMNDIKKDTPQKQKALTKEVAREWVDKVASFAGIHRFYLEMGAKQRQNWSNFSEFHVLLEEADMTYKKLTTIKDKGEQQLEDFLKNVKNDYGIYKRIPTNNLTFPEYLRYINADPNFRANIQDNINSNGRVIGLIYNAKRNWLNNEYAKYQTPLIESLFDNSIAPFKWQLENKVWVKKGYNKPLTWAHFVNIMTYARNEIEKGNTQQITRLFKARTGLIRTVVINPLSGRVSILQKGKGAAIHRSSGSFKSVSQRIVVEKDNHSEIYAELTMPLPKDKNVEEWRKEYESEFAMQNVLKDQAQTVFDIDEYEGSKGLSLSWGTEWLAKPELNMKHIGGNSLRTKTILYTDVLAQILFLNSQGYIHVDVKPENMGAKQNALGSTGVLTDFGLSKPIFTKARFGSPLYYCPSYTSQLLTKGYFRLVPQGDLWAFGLSLFQILSGGYLPEVVLSASNKATLAYQRDNTLSPDIEFSKHLKNVTQKDIDANIEKMTFFGRGADTLSAENAKELKAILKGLLKVDYEDPVLTHQKGNDLYDRLLKLIDKL